MISFLFIAAGLLTTINDITEDAAFSTKDDQFTFFDSLYFVIISISTVGFGDIYPISFWARLVTLVMIVVLIAIVPRETGKISELMDKTSQFDAPYYLRPTEQHIIVVSEPSCTSVGMFLAEFYHPDHGVQETNVVLLNPAEPCEEFKDLIESIDFAKHVTYVKGSVTNPVALAKVKATEAQAIFILPDLSLDTPVITDLESLLAAKSLSNFSNAQMYIELLQPASMDHCQWAENQKNMQSVCVETLKMAMVATSCYCAGLSTLLNNLIISTGEISELAAEWVEEYVHGYGQEVYTVAVGEQFKGWYFHEIAAQAYEDFGICIFAVTLPADAATGLEAKILINPANYQLCGLEQCCLIADDMESATKFSKCDPSDKRPSVEARITPLPTTLANTETDVPDQLKQMRKLSTQNGHILLCGTIPNGIEHFMRSLRLVSTQTVVYLHPHQPSQAAQKVFNDFEDFFLMEGSSMSVSDLKAAGAGAAEAIVIFPGAEMLDLQSSAHGFSDMFTVYVANILTEHFPETRFLAEVSESSSMNFLKDRGMPSDPHTLWPCYCSGAVYVSNLFDALLAQAYYNNNLIQIISCLIGVPAKTKRARSFPTAAQIAKLPPDDPWRSPLATAHTVLNSSSYQECKDLKPIMVPTEYLGETYSAVFNDLILNHNCLPLGMYRAVPPKSNDVAAQRQEYVITNPTKDTPLRANDKLFVLCSNDMQL